MGLGTRALRFSWNFQNMLRSSHYQNSQPYFFPRHGMATRHKDFSPQNSKMTNRIVQKSLFFLTLYMQNCIYFFCFQYKLWKRLPWPNIFALSLLDTFSSRITMATSCREVYQTFRLNGIFHIFSKFENRCKKLQTYLEFAIYKFWKSIICKNI